MNNIQSVIIKKDKMTLSQAKKWIKEHNFKLSFRNYNKKKVEITKSLYRFRQQAPSKYKKYRIKKVNDAVSYVLGYN
tara:strand:+ start:1297 stop:1527 length:231 start_codon:yes stop_codon:yes gene_type:complete